MTDIGDAIREARKERGMSQSELARRVHVTPQYISAIERGKEIPSDETHGALCAALGIAVVPELDEVLDPDERLIVKLARQVVTAKRRLDRGYCNEAKNSLKNALERLDAAVD